MATTLEIINGISQVLANTHDGAIDADGEPVKAGLKREEGNPLVDSRVMDGFSVRFGGSNLIVSYQADIKLKELHSSSFESDIDSMIAEVVKFLKKEYKKLTGSSLSLSAVDEIEVFATRVSGIRSTVTAKKTFKIGGADADENAEESKDRLEDSFKKFLELGGDAKNPQNSKAKKDNFKQFDPSNLVSGQRNSDLK